MLRNIWYGKSKQFSSETFRIILALKMNRDENEVMTKEMRVDEYKIFPFSVNEIGTT